MLIAAVVIVALTAVQLVAVERSREGRGGG